MVKAVFGTQKNIENAEGLLKATLDLNPAEYKFMKIVDPQLHRRWKKDKLGVVDITLNTASGKVLHIEIQVNPDRDFIPRSLFYNDSLVVEQVGRGKPYKVIKRTISIMILKHTLLENESPDRYKNVYRFLNTVSHQPFTDLQELVIIELSKVPDEDDGTALWPWLKFFKCQTMEEMEMLALKHEEVAGAVREVRWMSPVRTIQKLMFEYEDAKRLRMGQDAYVREQGYNQAKAEDQEQIRQKDGQIQQAQDEIRELRRRLAEKE
jgi:predicted transposase/invertase (TIGR01784 family)